MRSGVFSLSLALAAALTLVGGISATSPGAGCRSVSDVLLRSHGVGACGVPYTLQNAPKGIAPCTWTSAPAKHGTVISEGAISCVGTHCSFKPIPGYTTTWLGGTYRPVTGRCSNGLLIGIEILVASVSSPSGDVCPSVRPNIQELAWFRVPASWGGSLSVIWVLSTYNSKRLLVGDDVEGRTFDLPGRADGCPLLTSSGSPFPP